MLNTLLVEDDARYRQILQEEDMRLIQDIAMSGRHDRITGRY